MRKDTLLILLILLIGVSAVSAGDNSKIGRLNKILPSEKELEDLADDIEMLAIRYTSALFLISMGEDNEVYLVVPQERTKFNLQPEYKISIEDLPERLKKIAIEMGEDILKSVILSFPNKVRYEYILKVIENYSNAVTQVTGRIQNIRYQFAGPFQQ